MIHTEILRGSGVRKVSHVENRETIEVPLSSTFGLPPKTTKREKMITAFSEPGPLTPEINEHYKFPTTELIMFLMAMDSRDTIYLKGHSGTGKSEMVNQIAARLNYNVVQVNFDGHLLRADLLGEVKIKEGETKFRYGLVPLGFTLPGTILLFDEVDAVAPETAFVLQRAVSGDRKFLMHETSEQFELHPQNIIAATANTTGFGDDTGLYVAGTNVQNFSFQNRWDTVMDMDYLSVEEESEVLKSMFPKVNPALIQSVCAVMAAARNGFKAGTLSSPLTTRDAIRWVTKMSRMPKPMITAEYSFLNRMPAEDAVAVSELIQRFIQIPEGDSDKYCTRGSSQGFI